MTSENKSIFSGSTIYRRHEERRQQSLARQHDTRPAVIRVLSGLPGLRNIIPPPARPLSAARKSHVTIEKKNNCNSNGDGVESFQQQQDGSTIFTSAVLQQQQQQSQNINYNSSSAPFIFSVATSAAAGGAVAAAFFFSATPGSSSLFPTTTTTTTKVSVLPLVQQQQQQQAINTVTAAFMKSPDIAQPSSSSSLLNRMSPQALIWRHASMAAIMLGTRAAVDRAITTATNNHETNIVSSILASGAAGGVLGMFKYGWHGAQNWAVIQSHMTAAMIYFGVYDAAKAVLLSSSSSFSTERQKSNNLSIAAAGAMAGVAFEMMRASTLVAKTAVSGPYHALATTTAPSFSRPLWFTPAIYRAAPAHALLFLVYENVLAAMSQ